MQSEASSTVGLTVKPTARLIVFAYITIRALILPVSAIGARVTR